MEKQTGWYERTECKSNTEELKVMNCRWTSESLQAAGQRGYEDRISWEVGAGGWEQQSPVDRGGMTESELGSLHHFHTGGTGWDPSILDHKVHFIKCENHQSCVTACLKRQSWTRLTYTQDWSTGGVEVTCPNKDMGCCILHILHPLCCRLDGEVGKPARW